MKSLKQIINRYIRSAAIVMALVILVVIAFAEILIEQGRVEDTAAGTFVRLEQIIEENENELKQVKEKYDKTCLHVNSTPFVRQYDIMFNRWGDFNAKGSTKQTIHAGIQEAGRGNHDERKDELQRNGSTI